MDQGHGAKPAGKLVHAGLTLGKVVRVGPARRPGTLGGGKGGLGLNGWEVRGYAGRISSDGRERISRRRNCGRRKATVSATK